MLETTETTKIIPIPEPGPTRSLKWIPVIILGLLAGIMMYWNGWQAEILQSWARDRYGRELWQGIQRQFSGPLRQLVDDPSILPSLLKDNEELVGAGILGSSRWVTAVSKTPGMDLKSIPLPKQESSNLYQETLAVTRLFFRGGPAPDAGDGRGHQRGRGPPWLRTPSRENSEAMDKGLGSSSGGISSQTGPFEIVLVFREQPSGIEHPLKIQQGLWLLIWIFGSLGWLALQKVHAALDETRRNHQREAHLASVGRMTARLAHEIKNPLGAIRGTTQHLQTKLALNRQVTPLLSLIESETMRLEALTRGILDFARPPALQIVQLDLFALIQDVVTLEKSGKPEGALKIRCPEEKCPARGDPHGLKQVFLNLIRNALESCNQETDVEIDIRRTGRNIVIGVRDRGSGLGTEIQEKLFEPFFSTKTHGYGLGLVTSRRIIEAHGGTLYLKNREGGGCVAEVTLPEEESHG